MFEIPLETSEPRRIELNRYGHRLRTTADLPPQ